MVEKIDTRYVKIFHDQTEVERIASVYDRIKLLPAVPLMYFAENRLIAPEIKGRTLLQWFAEGGTNRVEYAKQMVDFVVGLNRLGYAHRDLHPQNIILSDGQLFVIDWDDVTVNRVPLLSAYDLTGAPSELVKTSRTYLFREYRLEQLSSATKARLTNVGFYHSLGHIPSTASMLGVVMGDFSVKMV